MNCTHAGRLRILFALVLTALLGLATHAVAQSQGGTGQIVGTVFDSSGAVIPNAKVSVVNKETALTRELQTGDSGDYRAILLPPGRYTVTVTHTGFKTSKTEVDVTVGSALTVDVTLAIGAATEVVEVTATPMVETTTPLSTSLVDLRSVTSLPINGRRFHDFVTLAPTVQIEPQRNQISFAGQRGINGNVTIDGADYNQPFFGGMRGGERSVNAFSIPQEAIAQFQVVPYGYSAEFGRSSGGLLNAVTKSGTNDWHGSGFFFARPSETSKVDALNRKALDNLYQYGGSIGGPIYHDKSFFFVAAEAQKNDSPRQVIFRRLDPITPTSFQTEAFSFFRSLEQPFTQTNDAQTVLARWDQQFNTHHHLSIRYHWSRNEGLNAVATGNQLSPETNIALESNGTEGDSSHNVTGQWTAIFSPRVVMETRAQYSKENRPRTPNATKAGFNSAIGDTGTRSFLPSVEFD
jgi:outer membrane receptor for ferrienterochelin and colicin